MTEKMDEKTMKALLDFMEQFASLNAENMRKAFDYIEVLKRSQEARDVGNAGQKPSSILKRYRCSFCGKTADQVERLIMGPGVHICNECVSLCGEVLKEKREQDEVEQN